MNCDFTKTDSDQLIDQNAKYMTNVYGLFNLVQLVEEPTRVTLEAATIIDYIATTCARNIIKAGIHVVSLSDHYTVYCIQHFNGVVHKDHTKIKTQSTKQFNENQFLFDVSGICWGQLFQQTNDLNILRASDVFGVLIVT